MFSHRKYFGFFSFKIEQILVFILEGMHLYVYKLISFGEKRAPDQISNALACDFVVL